MEISLIRLLRLLGGKLLLMIPLLHCGLSDVITKFLESLLLQIINV